MSDVATWVPEKPITDPKQLVATVLDIVVNHPEAHDQAGWIEICDDEGDTRYPDGITLKNMREAVSCGSTCCVAGWIVTLAGGVWTNDSAVRLHKSYDQNISEAAGELIEELADGRDVDVDRLFACGTAREDVVKLLRQMVDDEVRQVPGDADLA